jgi:DNA-binding response OmpR family regulator
MGETIFVVDDDPDMLEVIEEALVFKQYVVHRARDGQQAWEMLGNESPSIILADFQMPNLNGSELFDRVRGSHNNYATPFVFMSSTPELITSTGSYTVLRKPFNLDTLIQKVEWAITSQGKGSHSMNPSH